MTQETFECRKQILRVFEMTFKFQPAFPILTCHALQLGETLYNLLPQPLSLILYYQTKREIELQKRDQSTVYWNDSFNINILD